jgi:DNA-directed RNA polymerase alpha subunit
MTETEIAIFKKTHIDCYFRSILRISEIDLNKYDETLDKKTNELLETAKIDDIRLHLQAVHESLYAYESPDIYYHCAETVDSRNNRPKDKEILSFSILELLMQKRTVDALIKEGIFYISSLVTKTEEDLLVSPIIGKKQIQEIKDCLSIHNLCLSKKNEGIIK